MVPSPIEPLVNVLLYEGYWLYPYRPSALKNQHRWTFGCIVPRAYSIAQDGSEAWTMQTECLVRGSVRTTLGVKVRFLHLCGAESVERAMDAPDQLLQDLVDGPIDLEFTFPHELNGSLELSVDQIQDNVFKIRVRILNCTSFDDARQRTRDEALRVSFVSTHTILQLRDGQFISLQNPPEDLQASADACRNQGTWPVLAGAPGQTDLLLSAPIILGDYPQIAPESPGNFFDATEIDELLTLRIQTLTDQEKQEMMRADAHTRAMLQRVESLDSERQLQLHGAIREIKSVPFKPGERVRLRPRRRADAFDMLLDGKIATIISLEQDFESRRYVAVTVDDDPGSDLGAEGKPGHRFFFGIDEVEPLRAAPRILIAGVGNIFLGDDAFGVEVLRRLAGHPWPDGVRAIDFGIRGIDLAYALQDEYDALILVDAYAHGSAPGNLCVIEPVLDPTADAAELPLATHGMDPLKVLRWVQSTGRRLPRLRLVGCEPATFGPDEGQLGLSESVQAAIAPAAAMVEALVAELRTT